MPSVEYYWNGSTFVKKTITPESIVGYSGVIYIAGTGTTNGVWLGSSPYITSLYDGLTIAYKIPIAGASTTTLNINNLGAVIVRRNTAKLTTHLPANTVVLLTYTTISGTGYWVWANYYANTTYASMTQAEINTGTLTTGRLISPKLFKDNVISLISANVTDKLGTANGIATLGSDGKVPSSQLPDISGGGGPSYTYLGSRWGNGNIALASLHNSGYNFLLFRIAIDNYDDEEYTYTTYQTVTVDITKLLDIIHNYEIHTTGRIKPIVYDDQGDSETIITIQYRLYRYNMASYVFVMNSNSSIKVEVYGGKY